MCFYLFFFSGSTIGPTNVDSARQNLAASFVNGFVNAAFGQDKLLMDDGNKWLYKNKEHGNVYVSFLPRWFKKAMGSLSFQPVQYKFFKGRWCLCLVFGGFTHLLLLHNHNSPGYGGSVLFHSSSIITFLTPCNRGFNVNL